MEPVPECLAVWGDCDRLRQVLSNVVGNACTYCPPGSTVTLCAAARASQAALVVRDDGPGIPPADLARLGERFYRGDAARSRGTGGTGLGLAIARGIAAAHGGALAIESALGVGTTVTITLPLAPRAALASSANS
jgi:signal transduction histidine kinase